MAEPIYKFFMGRFLEPWYQLSKEEQDSLQAKLRDAKKNCMQLKLVLGSMVVPDIEAVQKYMAALQELNWFRYCESRNVLGTKLESS